jgi:hypothetical protein
MWQSLNLTPAQLACSLSLRSLALDWRVVWQLNREQNAADSVVQTQR